MKLTSSAFENEKNIPSKYTCDGEDINPPLVFSEVPQGVKSFALIMDDSDASSGFWVHWIIWNIKPDTREIRAHLVPPPQGAREGVTSFGRPGYGGPCPPDGEHRYFFKLYALDIELDLSPDTDKEALEEGMMGHVLDKAELVGKYLR